MNSFERYGEALLLAHEGNTQIAEAIAAAFKRMVVNVRSWLGAMPTTLPPTESFQPK